MRGGDVAPLARVGRHVVELATVDQPPPLGHHRRLPPLDRQLQPVRLDEERPLRPRRRGVSQQRREARAVRRDVGRRSQSAQFDQRGQEIDVGGEPVDVAPADQPGLGPANEARHAVSAVVLRALLAAHARVEPAPAARVALFGRKNSGGRAVVGHEDEDRVLGQPQLGELLLAAGPCSRRCWRSCRRTRPSGWARRRSA